MAERKEEVRRKLRERAVPASAFGRAAGFARLGASLVYGTMSDSVSRLFRGPPPGEAPPADGAAPNRCGPAGRRDAANVAAARARGSPRGRVQVLLPCRRCVWCGGYVGGGQAFRACCPLYDKRQVLCSARVRGAALTQARKAARAIIAVRRNCCGGAPRLAAGRERSR
jgi:hypothetical protein